MRLIFDVLLIFVSSVVTLRCIRLVTRYRTNSLADFALLLLFLFQTTPVICDLFFGIPKYASWFSGFTNAMTNDSVCIIYDIYVIAINVSLYFVSKKQKHGKKAHFIMNIREQTKKVPDFFLIFLILSPVFQILISGEIVAFSVYSSIGGKGLSPEFMEVNSVLTIVAILALMLWYFKKNTTFFRVIAFAIFTFLIIWISGKRYTIVTILYSFVYIYIMEKKNERTRLNMTAVLFVCVLSTIMFSIYYISSVKVMSDGSFDSTYASLRMDFGRDDVVKFTIWKEYIQGKHILEYPLQSVFSTIFMIVPRLLVPNKGYPHYRYLTATLFNTDIFSIPAGMTPSILEMMISNFRYFGMPICILFLCWYCKKADRARTSFQRYCYAMVMLGMLSQSLDSMIVIFYAVFFFMLTEKVKFVCGKRN